RGWLRREHARSADCFNVLAADGRTASLQGLFGEKFQGEERRVPLIHVVTREVVVTQSAQDPNAPDSQHHFLAKAIVRVASIERARKVSIRNGIGGQLGI